MTEQQEIDREIETIDCTPTWEALLPYMLAVLKNPKASLTAIMAIEDELKRMAKLADQRNEFVRDNARAFLNAP